MTDTTSIGVAKSKSLESLNHILEQREAELGPLVEMGNKADQTILVFDTDQDPPASPAVIMLKVGEDAVVPEGATQVCEGRVYVSGQLRDCIAVRE